MKTYYEVRVNDLPRFSSLSLKECEEFAKNLYRGTGDIPEILEITK